ncbi:MAG: hypothetical protein HRT58_15420 [Crocinitomicaceae bacterium]|nr:hypothetical protein [Flavobacteriales bacterium]NQZ37058.1 hypothetical protein [Crocinitomicaceae bacterium]
MTHFKVKDSTLPNLILIGFLLIGSSVFSQRSTGDKAIAMGFEYMWAKNKSGLGIGCDFAFTLKDKLQLSFGPYGGVAWGKYQNDLSQFAINSEANKQMSGDVLISAEITDETDGGWVAGGSLLLGYNVGNQNNIFIGPTVSFFSKQDMSALVQSSTTGGIYTEFAQIPYWESQVLVGIEANFNISGGLNLKYAYIFRPDEESPMHMFGLSYNLVAYD